jgi:hypothetical protein
MEGRVEWGRVGWYICGLGRLRVAHMANNEFDDSSLQLGCLALVV